MSWRKYLLCIVLGFYSLLGCTSKNEPSKGEIESPEAKELLAAIAEQNAQVLPYIYKNAEKLNLCDGELEQEISKQFSIVHPLGNGQYIVEFLCFMGAYQGNYQYLFYSQQGESVSLNPLILDRYEPDEKGKITKTQETNVGGLFDYNPVQKTLQITTKYRGLADCGSLARYQWQSDRFKLIEYRIKEKCDGQFVDPEKYAKVYP